MLKYRRYIAKSNYIFDGAKYLIMVCLIFTLLIDTKTQKVHRYVTNPFCISNTVTIRAQCSEFTEGKNIKVLSYYLL